MPAPHHPPSPRDGTAKTAMLTVSIWHNVTRDPEGLAHRLQRIHPRRPDGEGLHLRHPAHRGQPAATAGLAERDQDLAAARAANPELVARLNPQLAGHPDLSRRSGLC